MLLQKICPQKATYHGLAKLHEQTLTALASHTVQLQAKNLQDAFQGIITEDGAPVDGPPELIEKLLTAISAAKNLAALPEDIRDMVHACMDVALESLQKLVEKEKVAEQLAGKMSRVADHVASCCSQAGFNAEGCKNTCASIAAHSALQQTVSMILSYTPLKSFVEADKKDDAMARRLLHQYHECERLHKAAELPLMSATRKVAWECLSKVVALRQTEHDAMLEAECVSFEAIAKGDADGKAWKDGLADKATWEMVVQKASQVLFQQEKGKKVQTQHRKLLQVLMVHVQRTLYPMQVTELLV